MDPISIIFYIVILIMSVVIHEVSHGYAAHYFGDKTALFAGRLTLNPFKHLDLFGSFVVPFLLILANAPPFGWAKPMPYNERNLSNVKWGTISISLAGVLANFFIAICFGLFMRFGYSAGLIIEGTPVFMILQTIVSVNLVLGLFNLIPIPPLDGSGILFAFLPPHLRYIESVLEKYGFLLLLGFIFLVPNFIAPLVYKSFSLITGI